MYLGNCDICFIVKLIVFNNYFDVFCVFGLIVGMCIDSVLLKWVKEMVFDIVVLVNMGVCLENVEE